MLWRVAELEERELSNQCKVVHYHYRQERHALQHPPAVSFSHLPIFFTLYTRCRFGLGLLPSSLLQTHPNTLTSPSQLSQVCHPILKAPKVIMAPSNHVAHTVPSWFS
eukprot:TRINITY_DN2527_c0_g1_i4.p1 TRINITY_DN2527_c0_g1~~TRINITY_DN2527_c0_g1_i4.p1  ORF type:complete len:108 (-),score=2.32 TRINITY_DN2527_c0_g1_i4:403-726(-)